MEASYDLALRVGDAHRLRLGGLGSAGYAWEYEVEGDAGAVTVSMASDPSPPRAPPGGPPPSSYSVEHELVIAARAPGVARITASLRRPWQRGQPAPSVIRATVTVRP